MSATALLYGAKAAAGVAQGVFGYRQMQEASRREDALRAQGVPQMQTAQEYFDLYQNASRSRQFEQEKAATQSILASNLATLQQAGSRAVIGGASAAQVNAQRGLADAANRDFNRQQQALSQLAAAQQQTNQLNFQVNANQYARDLLTAQAGYQAGAETMMAGVGDAIGGAAGLLSNIDIKRKPKEVDLVKTDEVVTDPVTGATTVEGKTAPESVVPETPTYFQGTNRDPQKRKMGQEIVGAPQTDYGTDFASEGFGGFGGASFGGFQPTSPDGFQPTSPNAPVDLDYYRSQSNIPARRMNEGGSVTTPGKYTADHSVEYDVKTKSGKTIATVTGDETLVFNPKQRRFLKKVIGKLIKGQTIKPSKADTKQANQTLKAFKK